MKYLFQFSNSAGYNRKGFPSVETPLKTLVLKDTLLSYTGTQMSGTKDNDKFSKEEIRFLNKFHEELSLGETQQLNDLEWNCNNRFQFAKTHSVLLKDWKNQRLKILEQIKGNEYNASLRPEVVHEMVRIGDRVMKKKMRRIRDAFERKFGESIFNYLGAPTERQKVSLYLS